jgi:hypothetical protein
VRYSLSLFLRQTGLTIWFRAKSFEGQGHYRRVCWIIWQQNQLVICSCRMGHICKYITDTTLLPWGRLCCW